MDKQVSRRNEALALIENLLKGTINHREEISKELALVDDHRDDLIATSKILTDQIKALQSVLEQANFQATEKDAIEESARAEYVFDKSVVQGYASKAERWPTK